jgi:hypothetical protein
MSEPEIEVHQSEYFDEKLKTIVPQQECRDTVLRTIRFSVRIPGFARYAGIAAPVAIPVYALPIRKSAFNPPLIVSFMYAERGIVLMNVNVTDIPQD